MSLFPWYKRTGVQLLGGMIFACFEEIAQVFSRVDVPFYILTNNISVIQFLLILAHMLVLAPVFILVILLVCSDTSL